MATMKLDDMITQLADELGIPAKKLASMDLSAVQALIESGDLDPAQKARLVRSQLSKISDFMQTAGDVLDEGSADEDAEGDDTSGSVPADDKAYA